MQAARAMSGEVSSAARQPWAAKAAWSERSIHGAPEAAMTGCTGCTLAGRRGGPNENLRVCAERFGPARGEVRLRGATRAQAVVHDQGVEGTSRLPGQIGQYQGECSRIATTRQRQHQRSVRCEAQAGLAACLADIV